MPCRALVAPFTVLGVFAQYPVHRTHRAPMNATLEQALINLHRRLVTELIAVECLAHCLAFFARQGSRLAHALARGSCRSVLSALSASRIEGAAMDRQRLACPSQRNRLSPIFRERDHSSFPLWT